MSSGTLTLLTHSRGYTGHHFVVIYRSSATTAESRVDFFLTMVSGIVVWNFLGLQLSRHFAAAAARRYVSGPLMVA